MNEAFYRGFIKRAAEYNIPHKNAAHLYKQADIMSGLSHLTGIGQQGVVANAWNGVKNIGKGMGQAIGVGGNGFHPLDGIGNMLKGTGQALVSPVTGMASNTAGAARMASNAVMHPINTQQNFDDSLGQFKAETGNNWMTHTYNSLKNGINGANPVNWDLPGAYHASHQSIRTPFVRSRRSARCFRR